MPTPTLAQEFSYTVVLDIPESYRALLEQHLDIYTWRDNPRMNEDQLRLLLRQAPANIRELLATEGFYTPVIDAGCRRTTAPGQCISPSVRAQLFG